MNVYITKFLKRAIILMAPLLFIACEKDNGQVGLQLVDDLAGFEDTTLSVVTYTRRADSVLVALNYETQVLAGGYRGARLLGSMVDPVFGKASAGLVSQLILNEFNLNFKGVTNATVVVDSVVLTLNYNSAYGDTTVPMDLEVYELANTVDSLTSFYSDFQPELGQVLGQVSGFVPDTSGRLKFYLDKNYFQSKIADKADGNFSSFENNSAFVQYFKGIYVKPSTENGSILSLNLATNSGLTIYYRSDEEPGNTVLSFSQDKTRKPILFNTFEQDYANYPTEFDLSSQDTVSGEAVTYVQSMGGLVTVLKIPDVQELVAKDNIIINRAFIDIPVIDNENATYPPSGLLELREFSAEGLGPQVEDFNRTVGDGKLRNMGNPGKGYRFEITQHLFNVINGSENSNLVITPVNRGTTANRSILEGSASATGAVKLKVYYTKP